MRRSNSWTRWPLLLHGAALALLGLVWLAVEHDLPIRIEHALGNGIFDPRTGGDPALVRHHHVWPTVVALLLIISGTAHVAAGVLYRRGARSLLVALAIVGAVAMVPTSIGFAILSLIALGRGEQVDGRATRT
jgi:hypothetical protein